MCLFSCFMLKMLKKNVEIDGPIATFFFKWATIDKIENNIEQIIIFPYIKIFLNNYFDVGEGIL